MYKGITPTITLTLPEQVDLSTAQNVYVTLLSGNEKNTKTGTDLVIDVNEIEMTLTQEETLAFAPGAVYIQVNWTYTEGGQVKRAASDVASIIFKTNLENEVLA